MVVFHGKITSWSPNQISKLDLTRLTMRPKKITETSVRLSECFGPENGLRSFPITTDLKSAIVSHGIFEKYLE